jgi:hypothetical protein
MPAGVALRPQAYTRKIVGFERLVDCENFDVLMWLYIGL